MARFLSREAEALNWHCSVVFGRQACQVKRRNRSEAVIHPWRAVDVHAYGRQSAIAPFQGSENASVH